MSEQETEKKHIYTWSFGSTGKQAAWQHYFRPDPTTLFELNSAGIE